MENTQSLNLTQFVIPAAVRIGVSSHCHLADENLLRTSIQEVLARRPD